MSAEKPFEFWNGIVYRFALAIPSPDIRCKNNTLCNTTVDILFADDIRRVLQIHDISNFDVPPAGFLGREEIFKIAVFVPNALPGS